ncbi:hypothetical protein M0R72_01650 [Candidatus Pacearchaeota archaeon]|nr:hypothetical protein [Candidatus Pacearchaeota archaeon]
MELDRSLRTKLPNHSGAYIVRKMSPANMWTQSTEPPDGNHLVIHKITGNLFNDNPNSLVDLPKWQTTPFVNGCGYSCSAYAHDSPISAASSAFSGKSNLRSARQSAIVRLVESFI